jgi:hypothetical protein
MGGRGVSVCTLDVAVRPQEIFSLWRLTGGLARVPPLIYAGNRDAI